MATHAGDAGGNANAFMAAELHEYVVTETGLFWQKSPRQGVRSGLIGGDKLRDSAPNLVWSNVDTFRGGPPSALVVCGCVLAFSTLNHVLVLESPPKTDSIRASKLRKLLPNDVKSCVSFPS